MEIGQFIIISLMCGFACVHYYKLGMRTGAERMIQALHTAKIISYDGDHITPYGANILGNKIKQILFK